MRDGVNWEKCDYRLRMEREKVSQIPKWKFKKMRGEEEEEEEEEQVETGERGCINGRGCELVDGFNLSSLMM